MTNPHGVKITNFHSLGVHDEQVASPGGGGSISATDGTVTVNPATSIRFTGGVVADGGQGVAIVSSVIVADADPGAVGAGRLWLQTNINGSFVQLNIRDVDDAFWVNVTPVFYGTNSAQTFDSPDGATELTIGTTLTASGFVSDTRVRLGVYGGGAEANFWPDGKLTLSNLPSTDPFVAGQVYTDGGPSAGVAKALMVSGG